MKSPFEMFSTSKASEKEGIRVDYGSFRVVLARAGGANQDYLNLRTKLAKPYMRLIERGTFPQDVSDRLDRELLARTVIRNFEVAVPQEGEDSGTESANVEWQQGVPTESGEILPYTVDNLISLFEQLPDLFADIRRVAHDHTQYLNEAKEEGKGN